ncbi:4-hydroxy-3-methylbut-2-enyl diphosphate reductase [Aquirufa sp. HETE-83D]|uniref:4-hydroxy-3-methylbut-2-enyl diphosphate reductase n=1 Tax=Aquirufa esocilacus TaxID=3096513 RepID=A0ABW6DKT8_9BACT
MHSIAQKRTFTTQPPHKRTFKKMKSFSIPSLFKSNLIGRIKEARRVQDKLKKDFTPTHLDFGPVEVLLSRHFGFCYGVENAVETAYQIIDQNPDKRIFLLSEMIHNPAVNADLLDRGVRFIQDTHGNQIVDWSELSSNDVVIVPAFGTTLETQAILQSRGIDPYAYDTTCPFVEKVWNRADAIGKKDYTVIVHGKPSHEETKATFSHSQSVTPTLIIKDIKQAIALAAYIKEEKTPEEFFVEFDGQYSAGFNPAKDLKRIGVVNQTTMLATDTQEIVDYLRQIIRLHFQLSPENIKDYFADTRDTLCYATNDNQSATYGLLAEEADFAIVAGGYNSSNTAHLVDLCVEKLPTYFIKNAEKLISGDQVLHFDNVVKEEKLSQAFIPTKEKVRVLLTCGASCPDAVMEEILRKLVSFFPGAKDVDEVVNTNLQSS